MMSQSHISALRSLPPWEPGTMETRTTLTIIIIPKYQPRSLFLTLRTEGSREEHINLIWKENLCCSLPTQPETWQPYYKGTIRGPRPRMCHPPPSRPWPLMGKMRMRGKLEVSFHTGSRVWRLFNLISLSYGPHGKVPAGMLHFLGVEYENFFLDYGYQPFACSVT